MIQDKNDKKPEKVTTSPKIKATFQNLLNQRSSIENAIQGFLMGILAEKNLDGNWSFDNNGDIVKVEKKAQAEPIPEVQ